MTLADDHFQPYKKLYAFKWFYYRYIKQLEYRLGQRDESPYQLTSMATRDMSGKIYAFLDHYTPWLSYTRQTMPVYFRLGHYFGQLYYEQHTTDECLQELATARLMLRLLEG